jgi:hypothetical protein
MNLVPDWKSAWRWHSTQAMVLAGALPLAWAEMPPDLKASVPESWLPYITAVILAAGVIGRLRKQPE